jgi:Nif-specific regulatory protein
VSFPKPDPAVARQLLREMIEREFLGKSRAAVTVRKQMADFLAHHATQDPPPPILFRGETGVGESLLARVAHQAGRRRAGPFLVFQDEAIPELLYEAELFGLAPGSFTPPRPGLF